MKHNADGSLEWYKIQLAAKGFTQTNGMDYRDKFPPVETMNPIEAFLALVTNLG